MRPNDKTLTPQDIAEGYMRSYYQLHGRQPKVQHMGGYWYRINGEVVHRSTLVHEIINLRQLIKEQKKSGLPKGIIQRLITRIKAI